MLRGQKVGMGKGHFNSPTKTLQNEGDSFLKEKVLVPQREKDARQPENLAARARGRSCLLFLFVP